MNLICTLFGVEIFADTDDVELLKRISTYLERNLPSRETTKEEIDAEIRALIPHKTFFQRWMENCFS